jgi:methionine-gamma-lyase
LDSEAIMSDDSYHKDRIANRKLHPETLMMGFGYSPAMSEGSLKPPIFLTSTFVFENAQQGKDFFDFTSGRRQPKPGEKPGLVYSRFNHPNMEILEDRLAIWDEAEKCAVFASGMAAIATTCFAFLRPGDTIIHSRPLYGGTETLLKNQMGAFGVTPFGFTNGLDIAQMRETAKAAAAKGRVGMILVETPANPTNGLVDLAACKLIADELEASQGHRPPVVVDNTMLGPKYQKPLKQGADLSLLSLTKYVGGHSDLVGGSISGAEALVRQVKSWRGSLGTQLDPNSCWMLMRSLETLDIRMSRANENARLVADYPLRPSEGRQGALSRRPQGRRSAQGGVRPAMHGGRLDLRLRRGRRREGGLRAARQPPDHEARRLARRHRDAGLASRRDDAFGRCPRTARGDRPDRRADPYLRRHREHRGSDLGPGPGAGSGVRLAARHCERSEAIQPARSPSSWIASSLRSSQ